MRRLWVFGLTFLVGIMMSCGGDNPTEPVHELVGSWVYQSSEFSATAARNLQNYMVNQGLDLTSAVRLVAEFRNEMDTGFRNTGLETVRFNQDRTYEGNSGNSGVWSVQGDVLTIILNREQYLNIAGGPGGSIELDPDTVVLLDILFGDGDSLRLIYMAR